MTTRRVLLLSLFVGLALCVASPAGAGSFKVAAIYSLTGQAAAQNGPSVEGVRVAGEEINARGGILGMPLELVVLDNRGTPIGAKVAAEEAARLGVLAIIGCNWSSHSLAAAQVAQANGIPMISNISTHPDVTRVGDYIFRVCFTDDFQGKVMASFAHRDLGASTAVNVVDISDDYSLGLAREFQQHFTAMGGGLVPDVTYKHTQEDFKDAAAAAAMAKVDVCFIPGHDESGRILDLMHQLGSTCVPLGGDGWGSGKFYPLGGERLALGYYCTHWHPDSEEPASKAFVARYGRKGPVDPSMALAYDALMLLADAAARAGKPGRAAIRDALAATTDFVGVTGKIAFDTTGDPVKGGVIMRIANGRADFFKFLAP